MARNGCKKVLIVNGHGGNDSLLPFFARHSSISRMTMSYTFSTSARRRPADRPGKTQIDMHAGESETSKMMISLLTLFTSIVPRPSQAPINTARIFPKVSTPESGGTRAFPNH